MSKQSKAEVGGNSEPAVEVPAGVLAALKALDAGIDEANRRERGDFDGLLGQLPDGASLALQGVVSDLRDYLLNKYPEDQLRELLEEYEPRPGFQHLTPVDDGVELALQLFIGIRSAMRCEGEHLAILIFGKAGARDEKRQAGTRKERRPEVTEWIDKQLARDPHVKSPELWSRAPAWLKDQISIDRFKKRLTNRRKKVASN